ncbi:hypothetical protein lbkm_1951 [Lachnospiraceae bacterium KM106-2]|nr:hypothetical protein lbkm_1951 [Lachnospiraceae bacterium KM106-2]
MAKQSMNTKAAYKVTSSVLHLILNALFYVLVIFVLVKACTFSYQFAYQVFGSVQVEQAPGTDRVVDIRKGEATMDLATALEMKNIIVNKYSFYLRAKLANERIMPGTYTLNTSMDYNDILNTITKTDKEKKESSE